MSYSFYKWASARYCQDLPVDILWAQKAAFDEWYWLWWVFVFNFGTYILTVRALLLSALARGQMFTGNLVVKNMIKFSPGS